MLAVAVSLVVLRWIVAACAAFWRARKGALGVLEVSGVIGGGGPLLGGTAPRPVCEALARATRERRIRALVLRLDTPGGNVGATQEIAEELDRFRAAGKAVVASVGDIAASGGFWLASRADRIVAPAGAVMGSIGVIFQKANLARLYEKVGVEPQTIVSGPHKDLMSPSRGWNQEEEALLGEVNRSVFEQFVAAVATGRRLDEAAVRAQADGRIFTAQQALALGLCDELGNFQTAVRAARSLAGLPDSAPLVPLQRRGPLGRWLARQA